MSAAKMIDTRIAEARQLEAEIVCGGGPLSDGCRAVRCDVYRGCVSVLCRLI